MCRMFREDPLCEMSIFVVRNTFLDVRNASEQTPVQPRSQSMPPFLQTDRGNEGASADLGASLALLSSTPVPFANESDVVDTKDIKEKRTTRRNMGSKQRLRMSKRDQKDSSTLGACADNSEAEPSQFESLISKSEARSWSCLEEWVLDAGSQIGRVSDEAEVESILTESSEVLPVVSSSQGTQTEFGDAHLDQLIKTNKRIKVATIAAFLVTVLTSVAIGSAGHRVIMEQYNVIQAATCKLQALMDESANKDAELQNSSLELQTLRTRIAQQQFEILEYQSTLTSITNEMTAKDDERTILKLMLTALVALVLVVLACAAHRPVEHSPKTFKKTIATEWTPRCVRPRTWAH